MTWTFRTGDRSPLDKRVLDLSSELARAGIKHQINVEPHTDGGFYRVIGISSFDSVRAFADACTAANFDAKYSAASGWYFIVPRAVEPKASSAS